MCCLYSKGSTYYSRLSDKNNRYYNLIEYSYKEPDNYSYNRSGYKTVKVYKADIRQNRIYLYETSYDNGYYIDSDTTIETSYSFNELTRKDESFFRYADIQIIADKYGHIEKLNIR